MNDTARQDKPIPNNAGWISFQAKIAVFLNRWPIANSIMNNGSPSITMNIMYGIRNAPKRANICPNENT